MTQILPAAVERRDDGRTVFTRTVEVTTPVFGGGVHLPDGSEKPIDPITPIRGAGLRGQLRFWWRAMYGCQFALVEMKATEARIWGRDAVQEQRIGPSKVALRVGTQPRTERCNILGDDGYTASLRSPLREALGYAAFPLRQKDQPDGWVTRLLGKTRITLSVDADGLSPAEVASVEAAFDAWLSFGGVGGRTRRGFGAVSGPHSLAVDLLGRACSPRAGSQIPNLGAARTALSRASFNTALEAWAHGLDRLKTMRQGLGVGRHRKDGEVGWKAAGRSNWPEPDEIRRLTRDTARSHAKPVTAVRAMPRAAFGMPIIFEFKDEKVDDPKKTTLKPRGADRLASPLIIRPTLMADGRYKTLALVLGGSCAHDLAVELSGNRQSHVVRTRLTAADASRGRPARPLQGEPDPLQAFLNFIAKDPSA